MSNALPRSDSDLAAASAAADVVVVTGISGAGKSLTLKWLEDLGYEAVDNLPLSMLGALLRGGDAGKPLAIGIDIRTRDFGAQSMLTELDRLREETKIPLTLVFLESDDDVLSRRFTETRRRHPLAVDRPLLDGIAHERALIAPLKARADLVLDTSSLPPAELRRVLAGHFRRSEQAALTVFVTSFSYRRGLPREADLVFNVRFLDNPHYIATLKPHSGKDRDVADFIAADPGFTPFFSGLTSLIRPLLPRFTAEGKSYLTIAIGCTGGRHRSVYVAEELTAWLREQGQQVDLRHRDLDEGERSD